MIPKEAIEKAIEGGWKPFKSIIVVREGEWERYWTEWTYRAPGMVGIPARISEHRIALDYTFWQALWRALKFDQPIWRCESYEQYTNVEPKRRRCDSDFCEYAGWKSMEREQHRFYDLILTGGDTEAFWQEILPNSK